MNTEEITDLIRDLAGALIEHPGDLLLEREEHDHFCRWKMDAHAADMSKLVGSGGSHVRALALLVMAFGAANESEYQFELAREPHTGKRGPVFSEPAAKDYDVRPARELLERIVAGLNVGEHAVNAVLRDPGDPANNTAMVFRFTILVRAHDDYDVFLVSPFETRPGRESANIVGAIGTLFRAIASTEGVRFEVAVELAKEGVAK